MTSFLVVLVLHVTAGFGESGVACTHCDTSEAMVVAGFVASGGTPVGSPPV